MPRFASMLLAAVASTLLALTSTGPATTSPGTASAASSTTKDASPPSSPVRRLVLVVVDSARPSFFTEPEVMPRLASLTARPDTRWLQVHSCGANFTLPCLQTVFEGRRSPFAGGLVQFLGAAHEGGGGHFFSQAEGLGRRIALVGNHTILDTYGRHARWTYNPYATAPDYYAADTLAIARARKLLADPDGPDLLVLHVVGTDKAGHFYQEGTEGYLRYWRQADEGVAAIAEAIDPRRDALVIMGDHGHDEGGSHTRETAALLLGRPLVGFFDGLRPLPERIEQEDWMFLLGYAIGATLPSGYEGALWVPGPVADAGSFRQRLRTWLHAHGVKADSLAEEVAAWRRGTHDDPLQGMGPLLPTLLSWLLIGIVMAAVGFGPVPTNHRGARLALLGLPWGAVAVSLAAWASLPWVSAGFAVLLAASVVLLVRRLAPRQERLLPRLRAYGLLTAGALLTGLLARPWMHTFHLYANEAPLHPYKWVAFRSLFVGLALAAAWLLWRRARWAPLGAFAVSMIVLPSGVYMEQRGKNWVQGSFLLGAFMLLPLAWQWWRAGRPIRRLGRQDWERLGFLLLGAIAARGALEQHGNSWQWISEWHERFQRDPSGWLPMLLFVSVGMGLVARGRWTRFALAAVTFGGSLLVTGPFALPPGLLLSALLPVLAVLALWRAFGQDGWLQPDTSRAEALGWALAATSVASLWAALSGFELWNIRLDFARGWFHGAPTDAQLFVVLGVPVFLKYGLPILLLALGARTLLDRATFQRVGREVLAVLTLAVTATAGQAAAMKLGARDKLFELAAVGAFGMLWATLTWWAASALVLARPLPVLRRLPLGRVSRTTFTPEPSGEVVAGE